MPAREFAGPGTILRELRIKHGKSVKDIAAELGVSVTVPRKWESGDEWISESRVPGVCKSYGCEVADITHLVNWRDKPPPPPPEEDGSELAQRRRLGAFLKARRETLRHSNPEMAKLIGVSGATIYNWETGKHKIAVRILPALLHRYQIAGGDIAPFLPPEALEALATAVAVSPPPEPKRKATAGSVIVATEKRTPAGHGRPGATPPPEGPGLPLPAEVRIGVQSGGRIVMSATWEPGTAEGDRMANMAAEILVNIR